MHLGNYLGAIRNWVALQEREDFECFYCVVDYHAITVDYDPKRLGQQSVEMVRDLLACGLDPARSTIFVQSQVPEHTELGWILQATSASYGELQRMTQFKAKAEAQSFVTSGLFSYPVLQAADILLYDAERVPVGADQVQHLELTRDVARRFNNRFGKTFPEVEPLLTEAPRILSFRDPTQKMSKTSGDGHFLSMEASEKEARTMVQRAVTDVGPAPEGEMSPGVANLFTIQKTLGEPSVHAQLAADYEAGSLRYAALKGAVADAIWDTMSHIQARKEQYPLEKVREVIRAGAERARGLAESKIAAVRKRVGLVSV